MEADLAVVMNNAFDFDSDFESLEAGAHQRLINFMVSDDGETEVATAVACGGDDDTELVHDMNNQVGNAEQSILKATAPDLPEGFVAGLDDTTDDAALQYVQGINEGVSPAEARPGESKLTCHIHPLCLSLAFFRACQGCV